MDGTNSTGPLLNRVFAWYFSAITAFGHVFRMIWDIRDAEWKVVCKSILNDLP